MDLRFKLKHRLARSDVGNKYIYVSA